MAMSAKLEGSAGQAKSTAAVFFPFSFMKSSHWLPPPLSPHPAGKLAQACLSLAASKVVLYAMALSDYPWTCTRTGCCGMFECHCLHFKEAWVMSAKHLVMSKYKHLQLSFIHAWGFLEFIKNRKCRAASKTYIFQAHPFTSIHILHGADDLHYV